MRATRIGNSVAIITGTQGEFSAKDSGKPQKSSSFGEANDTIQSVVIGKG